jgi:hypothetical protein
VVTMRVSVMAVRPRMLLRAGSRLPCTTVRLHTTEPPGGRAVHRHARNATRLLSAALLRRQTEGTMRLSVDLGHSAQIGFP